MLDCHPDSECLTMLHLRCVWDTDVALAKMPYAKSTLEVPLNNFIIIIIFMYTTEVSIPKQKPWVQSLISMICWPRADSSINP